MFWNSENFYWNNIFFVEDDDGHCSRRGIVNLWQFPSILFIIFHLLQVLAPVSQWRTHAVCRQCKYKYQIASSSIQFSERRWWLRLDDLIFILSWIDIEAHKENQLLSKFSFAPLHTASYWRWSKIVSDNKEIYNRGIALPKLPEASWGERVRDISDGFVRRSWGSSIACSNHNMEDQQEAEPLISPEPDLR